MNPNNLELHNRINTFVLEKIAPGIMAHGGNVEITEFKDNKLTLGLSGNCLDCSLDIMTKEGIVEFILNEFAELDDCEVIDLSESDSVPQLADWMK